MVFLRAGFNRCQEGLLLSRFHFRLHQIPHRSIHNLAQKPWARRDEEEESSNALLLGIHLAFWSRRQNGRSRFSVGSIPHLGCKSPADRILLIESS